MKDKDTFTCKCGHCYFSVEEGQSLNDSSMAQLHCCKCGTTYNITAWCHDGLSNVDILEGE